MLLKCPECELQVSDKAANCPHCGYPLNPIAGTLKPIKSNKRKRKRLPTGLGRFVRLRSAAYASLSVHWSVQAKPRPANIL